MREGHWRTKSVPEGVKMLFIENKLFGGPEEVETKKVVHLDLLGRTGFHPAAGCKGCGKFRRTDWITF